MCRTEGCVASFKNTYLPEAWEVMTNICQNCAIRALLALYGVKREREPDVVVGNVGYWKRPFPQ